MNTKTIEITYSDKPVTYDGSKLDNVIDWDLVFMEQWARNNLEVFQSLVQTTIKPKIGKMILIGTNPDGSTNYLKDLFTNEK